MNRKPSFTERFASWCIVTVACVVLAIAFFLAMEWFYAMINGFNDVMARVKGV